MAAGKTNKKGWLKKLLIVKLIIILVAGGVVWYLFNKKFEDTSTTKAEFTVSAIPFLNEFRTDINAANKKYSEKIITVNGRISEIEAADSTLNVKMTDEATGDYAIFAFQQQDMAAVKKLNKGDSVSVKGSCSAGAYSELLETGFVTFKRCSLNK